MANGNNYVVKKKSTWWSLIKAVIVLAAFTYAAYKIYTKFFKKKKKNDLLDGVPEADELPASSEAIADPEVVFEASAEDVLADSAEQED